MKIGDKGEAVRKLQLELHRRHYLLEVDGDFGPETEGVVKQFQKDHKLLATGIADAQVTVALGILHSVTDRLAKAWYWTTQKAKYILGEGGRNPLNLSPFTPNENGKLGSDCIGFVLWCLGIDRYQPKRFTYYSGWMNTDSIIADAKTGVGGGLWKILTRPEPGCLVIFPSLWKNGKMTRMGHVGLVVEVPAEWPENFLKWYPDARTGLLKLVKVIDCNASLKRKLSGKAIGQITAATLWNKPDAVFVGWAG
jgi:hypothetical protein